MSANDPQRTWRDLFDHLVGAGEDRRPDRAPWLSFRQPCFSQRCGGGLQIPQSDIADYLGLSRETVSRALTSLKSDRIIVTSCRHQSYSSVNSVR